MDILAAFDEIEKQEQKKKASKNKKTPNQSLTEATRRNARQANRPQSQPVSRTPSRSGATTPPGPSRSEDRLSPASSPRETRSISIAAVNHERSQSADARRISFVDLPRAPPTRFQVKIPTKNDSLSSGFPYDGQRLVKYAVSAKEWNHFSSEVVVACDSHHYNVVTWPLARNKVIKKVRNDLNYGSGPNPGDVSKTFRKWNKLFRRQGFQAWMELPSEETADELGRSTAGMNKEDQKIAIKEAKRFRIVISPLDQRGGSIYSKSSIGKSVSREGGNFITRTGTSLISKLPKSSDVKEVEKEQEEAKVEPKEEEAKVDGANDIADGDKNNEAAKAEAEEESKG